jgi:hypothetical protein
VTDEEALALLAWAAHLDPRLKRTNEEEFASVAEAWAEVLTDVTVDEAKAAVVEHYRVSREPLMPADVLERVGWEPPSPHENITDQVAERLLQDAIDAAGVTRAQLEAAVARRDVAWIRAHVPALIPDERPGAIEQ